MYKQISNLCSRHECRNREVGDQSKFLTLAHIVYTMIVRVKINKDIVLNKIYNVINKY